MRSPETPLFAPERESALDSRNAREGNFVLPSWQIFSAGARWLIVLEQ
jgi:hypothetical protein